MFLSIFLKICYKNHRDRNQTIFQAKRIRIATAQVKSFESYGEFQSARGLVMKKEFNSDVHRETGLILFGPPL